MAGNILVRGARTHNLKNIDVEIPRERLVVITGVSGSGKSSLAFDTLYAEGQRRYLESLGADARQLLRQLERPDVDRIEGLSPTIAIEQKVGLASPRSTVGTLTDTYDYLRLLFARVGEPHCPRCGRAIVAHTIAAIVDELLALPPETRIVVLAPVTLENGGVEERLGEFARRGFTRFLVDGEIHEIGALPAATGAARELDLMIDRLAVRAANQKRVADSLEVAAREADGRIKVRILKDAEPGSARETLFSLHLRCPYCGIAVPEITPGIFSFNTPEGACPTCNGLGSVRQVPGRSRGSSEADAAVPCADCGGSRIRSESRSVRIGAFDIAAVADWPVTRVRDFFAHYPFDEQRRAIGQKITDEIVKRCTILVELGLSYLNLGRSAATLSAGELQRVRLVTELGSAMAGVLYVLDEPSIGLHQKDNAKLLDLLKRLRDAGNTVLVVEHDREAMLEADYLIDMGPAAGANGGRVIDQGTPAELIARSQSLTGRYLAGLAKISVPQERRYGSGELLTVRNARERNLKGITVDIPVGAMTCVTGVSGAGKSTLVMDVLYPRIAARLQRRKAEIAASDRTEILGWESFSRVVGVDQSPIGRTARSNPATYTGVFDYLRELFSQLPEARLRGYDSRRFSFNASGGRCEACGGEGAIRVEMHFLPEAYVTCAVCKGERFNRETLEIKYKGLSIADVLRLSIDHALELFGNIPGIAARLRTLHEVGLGYLALGQPASTLAGGEAQRVKLARELARQAVGRTLYVLDEPTAGLHFEDVKTLLGLLNRLVDLGNTVVIVEHNLDVIKSADHVIDLGPEGGERGGELIAVGTPEAIAAVPASATGDYLRPILQSKALNEPVRM